MLMVTNLVGFGAAEAATTGGNDANTILLLHFDGVDGATSSTDSAQYGKTLTFGGSAQIDTAQSKFGGSSLLLNTSSTVTVADDAAWDLGTGDFTVDYWIRFAALSDQYIFNFNTNKLRHQRRPTGNLDIYLAGSDIGDRATTLVANTWHHLAITRSGTTLRQFQDGSQLGANYTSSGNITGVTGIKIGDGGIGVNGWIDEFRVSNVARWTADFTPPTAAYS